MNTLDIVNLIISILSLFATVTVSFLIYWLQSRHEKEIKKIEEKRKEEEFKYKAEQFIFDNQDELEYLPFCIVVDNLYRHKKHYRRIYNNFCRCTPKMQLEILMQERYTFGLIIENNWIDNCFDKINKDIDKYQLGRDILYDGAKYFHRGLERYGQELWADEDKPIFKSIFKQSEFVKSIQDGNVSATKYMNDYFDYMLSKIEREELLTNIPIKPIDYIWSEKKLESNKEKEVCYWVMKVVEEILLNIHTILKKSEDLNDIYGDVEIKTYEDKYYQVLTLMYNTYM